MKMFLCFWFLFFSTKVFAYEEIDVCAKYKNTGKSYSVEALVYDGSELNSATNSFNYNSFSTYVVIFWSSEQATIVELDYYFGSIGIFGLNGKDQRGYPWEIREGTICF